MLTKKARYFQKKLIKSYFCFFDELFWMLETSDWLTQLSSQSESLQNSKKFAQMAKIWFDEFFWKYLTFLIVEIYIFIFLGQLHSLSSLSLLRKKNYLLCSTQYVSYKNFSWKSFHGKNPTFRNEIGFFREINFTKFLKNLLIVIFHSYICTCL